MDRELRRDADRVDVNRDVEVDQTVVRSGRGMDDTRVEASALGSVMESLGGIAAIVLGILGLASIVPQTLAAIGIIVLGAALVSEGSAVLAKYAEVTQVRAADYASASAADVGGGVMLEFLGGIAGIVLGVLALLSVAPITLLAIATIAFGATLILAGGSLMAVAETIPGHDDTGTVMARNAVVGTRSIEMLAGVGGVVLGILALIGTNPLTLILVSIIGFGSAILLTGPALTGRFLAIMSR